MRYAELPDVAAVVSTVERLELKLVGSLDTVPLPEGHAFFRALLASNRVDSSVRRETGVSTDALSKLLKANIVVAHPDGTFSFHSRLVERHFKEALQGAPHRASGAQCQAASAPGMAAA